MPKPSFWLRLQTVLCGILFFLIVLGAGVRLAHAGLACPDWPLCFGEAVPQFDFQVFMEWIHRVVAMVVGFFALAVSIKIFTTKNLRSRLGVFAFISLLLFGVQAFLGRQTVILFLKGEIVTAHLATAYILYVFNMQIRYRWVLLEKNPPAVNYPQGLKIFARLMVVLVFCQAVMGAIVSSHYAGWVCPDFPKCQGKWLPQLTEAIVIHLAHRLGALLVLLSGFALLLYTLRLYKRNPQFKKVHKLAKGGFMAIVSQWILGISMIFTVIHPGLSLLHSFFALSIFTMYLLLIFQFQQLEPKKR